MPIICPNKNSQAFKDLAAQFGENMAESLSVKFGDIPSVEQASLMLKGSKISQFKKAVQYIQNTTSNSVNDLMDNLFKIVQKVGNEYFVVKGSRINENPAPATELEVHTANRNFLSAINESFGNLFNVSKVRMSTQGDALGSKIVNDIASGEFDNLYALTYKRLAIDPNEHEELLNDLVEEVTRDAASRNEFETAFGTNLLNEVMDYAAARNVKEAKVNKVVFRGTDITDSLKKANINPNLFDRILGRDDNQFRNAIGEIRNSLLSSLNAGIEYWTNEIANKSVLNKEGDVSQIKLNLINKYQNRLNNLKNLKSAIEEDLLVRSDVELGLESPLNVAYKVDVNQDTLNKIVVDNIVKQEKEERKNPQTQKDGLTTNNKILNNQAPRFSRAFDKGVVGIVNHTVLNYLKGKFGIPFEIVSDSTVDWSGKFENGKVYINAAKFDPNAPVHEYLHPYTMAMQQDNPVLYNTLIQELQSTEEGQKVIEEIKALYPELGIKDQLDEALVTHISRLVDTGKIQEKPWYRQFIDWLKKIFSTNGVAISDLSLNTTINDIVEKIIDPSYMADLKRSQALNDASIKYLKTAPKSEIFDQLLDKIVTKLRLDVSIQPRTEEERARKFFSGRQLAMIEQNKDVFSALNDYVVSAIVNAKKMSDRFDEFKTFYESKQGKLTRDEMLKGMDLLAQIEQHVALYNESRFVIDAIRDADPDEYEDKFRVLANRLNKDIKLINSYHEFGLKLMSDWLYPHTEKANQAAIKSGNKEKILGYSEYLQYKQENPNMSDKEALERGVKKFLRNNMEHATTDMGFFQSYMSGVLNSNDPISQLIGISLKDEFAKNNDKLLRVKNGIQNVLRQARGFKLLTTNAQHKEFYSRFLRQADSWEKVGVDENTGNPIFDYVKRTAFHQEYLYDEFYKAKREMFKKIGIRPNKNDTVNYQIWQGQKEAWFDKNTKKVVAPNGDIKTVPSDNYRNPEFENIKNDPVFKEIYKHYQGANDNLGQYQLKYGIIPQASLGGGFFSDLKISKGIKGNFNQLKQNLKDQIGAEVNNYYAQDIDGKEYKNIPIRFTRMLEEEDLNYNLGQTVADFWEASSKYNTAKTIEPMILTLRNFIEGNSFLRIGERTAPETNAKGVKKLGNFVKNITKNKDQANINRMLVDFINDTVYGESEKKANVKSPFLNLKFLVYKDGDTSVNGRPSKQYVYTIEDLKKLTGNDNLTVDGFVKGKEKSINDYKVTLLRNDKILSVNKLSGGLNTTTSVVSLAGNVMSGVSNVLSGVANNFVEGAGGKHYNLKDFFSAFGLYFKGLTDFDFVEDTRGGKGSKVSQLLTRYGTFQGEFLNEYGKKIGQGVVNKLFRRSSLFLLLHGGEHMIQSTQMIALMRHTKVKDNKTGKEISLFDAFEKGKDGYVGIRDGVEWSEEDDAKFRDTLQAVHKDKGNYSEFDKAALNRLWWGKMILMFRRHIFNGIKARWGAEYVDYERGQSTQGYYRSFMTTLVSELNELRLNRKFRKLTDEEAYNFKKTSAEIGMFLMLLALVKGFKDDDDEKGTTGINDYIALFSRRLQQDVSFFWNPLEWKKVIQSPVVTGATVDKMYDFISQAAISPTEEYERDGFGYQAGDSKALVKLKKVIPIYGKIVNLLNPEQILEFYDLSRPVQTGQ